MFRSLKMVQVYQVHSHGRRFYRILEYTSNVRYSLRDMQPTLDDRQQPWLEWERHGAGHPYGNHWRRQTSCVITRGSDYAQNLSGGTEMLIPERLLYGVVPQALLEQYVFWQDEADNLRGYPRDNDEDKNPYMIEMTLEDVRSVPCSLLSGVCGTIRRVLRKARVVRFKAAAELVTAMGGTIASASPAVASQKLIPLVPNNMGTEADPTDPAAAESPQLPQASGMPVEMQIESDEDTWKFGFATMQRIYALVDSGTPVSDLCDLVRALRESGMEYPRAHLLLQELESYAQNAAPGAVAAAGDAGAGMEDDMQKKQSLEEADLTLVNIAFARAGSKFLSLLETVSRLENASYMLCWTRTARVSSVHNTTAATAATTATTATAAAATTTATTATAVEEVHIDLLELPRLKMSFQEQEDKSGVRRLFSLDHVNLFISNHRSELTTQLMAGLPQSLLLSSANEELQILVPSVDPVRPRISICPFTTGNDGVDVYHYAGKDVEFV